MATYSTTKRFLAGAICPRCEAVDRIQVYSADDKDYRECVACGFKDQMHFAGNARELPTRVVQPVTPAGEQVVKIVSLEPSPQPPPASGRGS